MLHRFSETLPQKANHLVCKRSEPFPLNNNSKTLDVGKLQLIIALNSFLYPNNFIVKYVRRREDRKQEPIPHKFYSGVGFFFGFFLFFVRIL